MAFYVTAMGCVKNTWRRAPRLERAADKSGRHWGHWRWLQCISQARYARALAHWHNLYGRRPRDVVVNCAGTARLNLEMSN